MEIRVETAKFIKLYYGQPEAETYDHDTEVETIK